MHHFFELTFLSRFLRQHCEQHITEEAVHSVFDSVSQLQALASTIALNQPLSANVCWNQDMSIMQHQGYQVIISDLTRGVQKMLDDLQKKMYDLSGGEPVEFTIPDNHVDDLSSLGRGRSWMDSCHTTPRNHALMESMAKKDLWNLSDSIDGEYLWNEIACLDFIRKAGDIVDLIITLVHLGSGPPLRGEELVLDQIENGIQPRTLYLVFGQMLAIRRRSKDTNRRGIDSFNACYFPKKLTDAICYYLMVIRPLEKLVAERLYPMAEDRFDYSLFLYVKGGKRMTSDEFSSVLSRLTNRYIGVGLTLQPARHIMIAFQRAFVEPTMVEKGNNVGDLLSSHTTKTANLHYAREFGFELEGLTSMLLLDIQEWCELYHEAIGLGNRTGPLIPIRTKRKVAQLLVTAAALDPKHPSATRAMDEILCRLGHTTYKAGLQELKIHTTQEIYTAVAEAFERVIADFGTFRETRSDTTGIEQPAVRPNQRLSQRVVRRDPQHVPMEQTSTEPTADSARRSKRHLSSEDIRPDAKRQQTGRDKDQEVRFFAMHEDLTGEAHEQGPEHSKKRSGESPSVCDPWVGEETRSVPDNQFRSNPSECQEFAQNEAHMELGDTDDEPHEYFPTGTAVPRPTKPLPSRAAAQDNIQEQHPPVQQLSAMSLESDNPLAEHQASRPEMSSDYLLQGLRRYLRDPTAVFKSEAQEELVRSVVSGRNTLGVLPTGSGKSKAFELAAILTKRSTIVAVPFRLLASQVHQNTTERGLAVERWDSNTNKDVGKVKLIIVAYETLGVDEFIE